MTVEHVPAVVGVGLIVVGLALAIWKGTGRNQHRKDGEL